MKRIGFVSTRIAGTDGVTLETYKWYQVLERNGYECCFFAGELDTPKERSMLEPKAHFETLKCWRSIQPVLDHNPRTIDFSKDSGAKGSS